MTIDSTNYAKLLEEAENAVSGIKNERLKEIAFDKLLSHLLKDDSSMVDSEGEGGKESPKRRTKLKADTSSGNKSSKQAKEGPKAWLRELIEENFFNKPKSSIVIREELETRSHHLKASDLTLPLQALCHEKSLRRKKEAPDGGGKAVLHWVNW